MLSFMKIKLSRKFPNLQYSCFSVKCLEIYLNETFLLNTQNREMLKLVSKKLLMFLRSKFLIIQTSAHALVSSVKLLSICDKSYIFMLFLAERSGLVGRGLDSG